MELLKQRILQDGACFPGGILKVDSFINHQMDPQLMYKIGEEFKRLFSNNKVNKIVTIEASGIAPAIMTGYIMNLPVVFVKKKIPKTMENMLTTVVHSFTKDRDYSVCISNDFLTDFKQFVRQPFNGRKFIAHCEEGEKPLIKSIYRPGENVLILIGPEGDFSPEEIKSAEENGFEAISLGKSRLRTETAALTACHTIHVLNQ
jgi:hypothetical protein